MLSSSPRRSPRCAIASRAASPGSKSARRSTTEQLELPRAVRARGDAHGVPDGIVEAVAILRDPERLLRRRAYASAPSTRSTRRLRVIGGPRPAAARLHRLPDALRALDRGGDRATPASPTESVRRLHRATCSCRGFARQARRHRHLGLLPRAAPAGLRVRPQASGRAARRAPDVGRPAHHAAAHPPPGPRSRRPRAVRLGLSSSRASTRCWPYVARLDECRSRRCRARSRNPEPRQRDRLLGASSRPARPARTCGPCRAPDFDGLALDKYFSPVLMFPYDPTRGCYWGKCTFCHYGLAEIGTASYRERAVETASRTWRALGEARDAALLSVAGLGRAQDARQAGRALADAGLRSAGPPTSNPRST